MRRNLLNFVIDAASLLVMLALAATGLLMHFVLPPGTGGRGGGVHSTVWGWGRHDWGNLHLWLSAAVGALLLVHVALHWNWVCGTIARMIGRAGAHGRSARTRNLYGTLGLGTTAALLAGFVWFASTQVVSVQTGVARNNVPRIETDIRDSSGAGPAHDEEIRGSMSLAEVVQLTGVPAETLRADLKLPQTTSTTERLGRLSREYGFEMSRVREVIRLHRSHAAR